MEGEEPGHRSRGPHGTGIFEHQLDRGDSASHRDQEEEPARQRGQLVHSCGGDLPARAREEAVWLEPGEQGGFIVGSWGCTRRAFWALVRTVALSPAG